MCLLCLGACGQKRENSEYHLGVSYIMPETDENGSFNLTDAITDENCAVRISSLRAASDSEFALALMQEDTDELILPVTRIDYRTYTQPAAFTAEFDLDSDDDAVYSIYIPAITYRYALYLNGTLLYDHGYEDLSTWGYFSSTAVEFSRRDPLFSSPDNHYTLTFRILPTAPGAQTIPARFYIGAPNAVHKLIFFHLSAFLFIVGACFLTAFYQFAFYYVQNKHRANIAFSIIAFSGGLSVLFSLDSVAAFMHPGLSAGIGHRVYLLSLLYLCCAIMIYFVFMTGYHLTKKNSVIMFSATGVIVVTTVLIPLTYIYVIHVALAITYIALAIWLFIDFSDYADTDKNVRLRVRSLLFSFVFLCFMAAITLISTPDNKHSIILPLLLLFDILLNYFLESREYFRMLRHTHKITEDITRTVSSIDNYEVALSSTQMSPEFVYKTFDSISAMCDTDRERAEDMTLALSKYLRMTLDYSRLSDLVSLQNEIELVKAYANIEKVTHPGVKVEYFMPNTLPEVMIPPMTIMPLVENAFEHAFPDGRTGRIILSVVNGNKFVTVTVTDEGIGIPDDILDNITDFVGHASIGINHVDYTLKKVFGRGLTFRTAYDKGTSVSFHIPVPASGKEVTLK